MNEHRLPEAPPPKSGTDVHALQLAVVRAVDLDAATARRRSILPHDEEGDTFAKQLVDAITVAAFARVQRREMTLEFVDQRRSVGTIRAFLCYYGRHACETQNSFPSTSFMFVQT